MDIDNYTDDGIKQIMKELLLTGEYGETGLIDNYTIYCYRKNSQGKYKKVSYGKTDASLVNQLIDPNEIITLGRNKWNRE